MVECGLEDITLKAARKKGYPDPTKDVEDYMKKLEETLEADEGLGDTDTKTNEKTTKPGNDGGSQKTADSVSEDSAGNSADDEASYASRISHSQVH